MPLGVLFNTYFWAAVPKEGNRHESSNNPYEIYKCT